MVKLLRINLGFEKYAFKTRNNVGALKMHDLFCDISLAITQHVS